MMNFKLRAFAITVAGLVAGTAVWAQDVTPHQQHMSPDSSSGSKAMAGNMEMHGPTSAVPDKPGDSMEGMDHGSMGYAQG
jgi:hypothetical protein